MKTTDIIHQSDCPVHLCTLCNLFYSGLFTSKKSLANDISDFRKFFLIAHWNSLRDRIVNKWIFLKIINRYYKPIQTEHFLCKLPLTFKAIEKKKTVSDLIYLTCLQIAAVHFQPKKKISICNRDSFLNYHPQ
jgi:hypothetical protein